MQQRKRWNRSVLKFREDESSLFSGNQFDLLITTARCFEHWSDFVGFASKLTFCWLFQLNAFCLPLIWLTIKLCFIKIWISALLKTRGGVLMSHWCMNLRLLKVIEFSKKNLANQHFWQVFFLKTPNFSQVHLSTISLSRPTVSPNSEAYRLLN